MQNCDKKDKDCKYLCCSLKLYSTTYKTIVDRTSQSFAFINTQGYDEQTIGQLLVALLYIQEEYVRFTKSLIASLKKCCEPKCDKCVILSDILSIIVASHNQLVTLVENLEVPVDFDKIQEDLNRDIGYIFTAIYCTFAPLQFRPPPREDGLDNKVKQIFKNKKK